MRPKIETKIKMLSLEEIIKIETTKPFGTYYGIGAEYIKRYDGKIVTIKRILDPLSREGREGLDIYDYLLEECEMGFAWPMEWFKDTSKQMSFDF